MHLDICLADLKEILMGFSNSGLGFFTVTQCWFDAESGRTSRGWTLSPTSALPPGSLQDDLGEP